MHSHRSPGWVRVAAALSLAAGLAGCGSYTKHDFTAQADAICISAVRQIRALTPPAFSGSAVQRDHALATYLNHATGIVASETAELRAIRRPQQDALQRAALARYLAAMTGTVSAYRELASAVESGDQHAVTKAQSELASDRVAALASAYGLRSCATPGATYR